MIEQVVDDVRCPLCGGLARVKERPLVRYVTCRSMALRCGWGGASTGCAARTQAARGGDESARYPETGTVVVLLGINGEGFGYVKVEPRSTGDNQLETLKAARRSLDETFDALEGFRVRRAATR
jgi:hypothetical protein